MRTSFIASLAVVWFALVACKEEWNENQLGVTNPYSESDDTEPADDEAGTTTDATATSTLDAGGGDATDARSGDARADARDATPG